MPGGFEAITLDAADTIRLMILLAPDRQLALATLYATSSLSSTSKCRRSTIREGGLEEKEVHLVLLESPRLPGVSWQARGWGWQSRFAWG